LQGLLADRNFLVVLLVWALCWLSFGVFLKKFSTPLPWRDEWELIPVATGTEPLTLQWFFQPANEHRVPLTRVEVLVLGRLFDWDLRYLHYHNLTLIALGALALVLAVRSVRGRSELCDVFLCLLVLSPWQFETVFMYCQSYAMALGMLCFAISAAFTGQPLRSLWHLGCYFGLLLLITSSGGPAGNIWALGLSGIVLRGWLLQKPCSWKIGSLVGMGIVGAVSGLMLLWIPEVGHHAQFRATSIRNFLGATARFTVAWLGSPVETLWPWIFLVVLVPVLYLLAKMISDQCRKTWIDLLIPFAGMLGVAAIMGYGRGHYPCLHESRFCTLLLPIGLMGYLLLVRLRARRILPVALAFVMTLSVGWNWPIVVFTGRGVHDRIAAAVAALKDGSVPLTIWANRYGDAVGWDQRKNRLVEYLVQLRTARQSVFKKGIKEAGSGMSWSTTLEAECGKLMGNIQNVYDPEATGDHVLKAISATGGAGIASYEVQAPATGCYSLCCRIDPQQEDQVLNLQIDDGPILATHISSAKDYSPYILGPFDMTAGKHALHLTIPNPGLKLDFLELIPAR
jgi:hypothetical protein